LKAQAAAATNEGGDEEDLNVENNNHLPPENSAPALPAVLPDNSTPGAPDTSESDEH
jgi:hypothetical protein